MLQLITVINFFLGLLQVIILYQWFNIALLDTYFFVLGAGLFFSGIATQYVAFTGQSFIAINPHIVWKHSCYAVLIVFILSMFFCYFVGKLESFFDLILTLVVCIQASLLSMIAMYSAYLNSVKHFKLAISLNVFLKLSMIIAILIWSNLIFSQISMICMLIIFSYYGYRGLNSFVNNNDNLGRLTGENNKKNISSNKLSENFNPLAVFCLLPFSVAPIIDSYMSTYWLDGELSTIALARRIEIAIASIVTIPYMGMFSRAVSFEITKVIPIIRRVIVSILLISFIMWITYSFKLIPISLLNEDINEYDFYKIFFWLCVSMPVMTFSVFLYRYFSGIHAFKLLTISTLIWFSVYFFMIAIGDNDSVSLIRGYAISWISVFIMLLISFFKRGEHWVVTSTKR